MVAPDKLSYRVSEAVKATGLGRTKIFELIKNGELQTKRVGGCTLIPAASLSALVTPQAEAA